MNKSDNGNNRYNIQGFDGNKYLQLQKDKVLERIDQLRNGKLYLEIGGKYLNDQHAGRTLPGFAPLSKPTTFHSIKSLTDLLLCVNSTHLTNSSMGNDPKKSSLQIIFDMASDLETQMGIKPKIVLNLCDKRKGNSLDKYVESLGQYGYEVFKRYEIDNYPNEPDKVLSNAGFDHDEEIKTSKKLILVTGVGNSSGKSSTCIGSIYKDHKVGISSGYSKFDTFPIWSLPISHPLNLAYEASVLDKGDFNVIDTYHEQEYGKRSVCSNKDIETFNLIRELSLNVLGESNPMSQFRSPSDLTINYAGSAITNDQVVCIAGLDEIRRRARSYKEIVSKGKGDKTWLKKCDSLENQAIKYIRDKGYDPEMKIT